MRVFRVEHERGHGPYQSRTICSRAARRLHDALMDAHGCSFRHPEPSSAFPNGAPPETHFYGFRNHEQASEWFEDFGEMLRQADFELTEYEVATHSVIEGRFQIAFHKDVAHLIERRRIDWS